MAIWRNGLEGQYTGAEGNGSDFLDESHYAERQYQQGGTRFIWNSGAAFACESFMRARFSSRAVAIAFACCAVTVAAWVSVQWWRQHNPQDFEQCSERAASSKDERIALMAQCGKLFAGRRKIGGRYTYYDFLQDRHFDMAGPNPTREELNYFADSDLFRPGIPT